MSFTKVPNWILDDYIIDRDVLSEPERIVLCYITRETIGWQKLNVAIPLVKFCDDLKYSKSTIKRAIRTLEIYDVIMVERGNGVTNKYSVRTATRVIVDDLGSRPGSSI